MMQVFCRVIDSGSFTRAADQMKLSKAVVSKYVKELEQRLDCRLINRTTRAIALTDAGRLYYQRSIDILDQIQILEADVAHQKRQVSGTLRVSIPHTFGEMFVAPRLPELMEQHPELKLDIQFTDAHISLVDEHIDLAIRIGKLQDSSLIAQNLGNMFTRLCASPAYLEQYGIPNTPEDLHKHKLIYDSNNPTGNWHFKNAEGRSWVIKVDSRISMNSAKAVREMLLRGEGIAIGPSFALDDCIEGQSLVSLLPEYCSGQYPISAVYPSARHVSEKVRVFIAFMRKILDENASIPD